MCNHNTSHSHHKYSCHPSYVHGHTSNHEHSQEHHVSNCPSSHDHGHTHPISSCHKKLQYATAYVLPQVYENLFSVDEAFHKGTIFKDLYRPYKSKEK